MGGRKLIIGASLILSLYSSVYAANSTNFENFKNEFVKYKEDHKNQYNSFKKAYDESFKEYKNEILKNWPKAETSSRHKWVSYDKNYKSKKVVDFEKKQVKIQVIAKNEKEAKRKIEQMAKDLIKDDVRSAYKNDKLQNKINKILKKEQKVSDNKKIIADVLDKKAKKNFVKDSTKKIKKETYKNRFIYKTVIKLPSDSVIKKAKAFKSDVNVHASKQKLPASLVYAIMHSESSFNPMARSHIPAFGLMQIVPRSAGVDTYQFLYGKKRLLSSSYLYNSKNNIKIGTAYLHILYYKYLRKIEDPQARLYCAIAAYNTGAGNVAKAFIGSYNITKASQKINKMSSEQVYNHLLVNLPYDETKKYLKKVTGRMNSYHNLIQKDVI